MIHNAYCIIANSYVFHVNSIWLAGATIPDFLKTDFPIHLNSRRVDSSNGEAKNSLDHVTKIIASLLILNSRRSIVQMRPNL